MEADTLRRRRNLYNKQVKEEKRSPEHIKARAKQKAARNARKKNR